MTQLPVGWFQRLSVAVVAAACCTLFAASAAAQTLTFKIDHFWCYATTLTAVNQKVQLQDQFDRRVSPNFRETVTLRRPLRFCNPVTKFVELTGAVTPIENPASHLKFYRIWVDDPNLAPVRKVKIQNQFGIKTIQTFDQL